MYSSTHLAICLFLLLSPPPSPSLSKAAPRREARKFRRWCFNFRSFRGKGGDGRGKVEERRLWMLLLLLLLQTPSINLNSRPPAPRPQFRREKGEEAQSCLQTDEFLRKRPLHDFKQDSCLREGDSSSGLGTEADSQGRRRMPRLLLLLLLPRPPLHLCTVQ